MAALSPYKAGQEVTLSSGFGIGVSGYTISNTRPAPIYRVATIGGNEFTYQPSDVTHLSFLGFTHSFAGNLLTLTPEPYVG